MKQEAYDAKINAVINQELDGLVASGAVWRAEFIAQAVLLKHADGLSEEAEHKEFWQHCGYTRVRDLVRRCINTRAGDDEQEADARQPRLPGYDHVHLYYLVRRNGDDVGVSVHEMTDAEIDAKAHRYSEMAHANGAHANELLRFKRERRARSAA